MAAATSSPSVPASSNPQPAVLGRYVVGLKSSARAAGMHLSDMLGGVHVLSTLDPDDELNYVLIEATQIDANALAERYEGNLIVEAENFFEAS
jgi:hypothetical protein